LEGTVTKRAIVVLVMCAAACTTARDAADLGPCICLPDGGPFDAALVDRWFPGDPDPVLTCDQAGLAGRPCRAGACQASLRCWDPAMLPANASTIQGLFNLQQGDVIDPMHPGYAIVQMPQNPMDSAPFDGWAGTFCAQECDTMATIDTCGACSACSGVLTQVPLVRSVGGVGAWYGHLGMYALANEGVCRPQCTFDRLTRGVECDMQHACDALSGTCIEACTSDNGCNTELGVTYSGALVTLLDRNHPAHCNTTTGRCEYAADGTPRVGAPCTSAGGCASFGLCLPGGLCAEFDGCTNARACGPANVGVCLATNGTRSAAGLCVLGCNGTSDCPAGNACIQLGPGTMIGGHSGYCFGTCTSDGDCAPTETCTDGATDPFSGAPDGRCVHRCGGSGAPIHVGDVGLSATSAAVGDCLTSELCAPDHAGADYGFCVAIDHLCGIANTVDLPAAATDCPTAYVCDETLATPHGPPSAAAPRGAIASEVYGDGHCTAACTASSCASPTVCVASGTLTGLCRQTCTADVAGTCPTDQHCNTTLGFCVECPTYLPGGTIAPPSCT
jgi:hypothetical protein